MSKSGYSRSGLFGTINHYDSHGHDTASYARVYQAVVTADKRRRSQRVEHDVRAKQTKVCDAERAGFHTPIFILVKSRKRRVVKVGRGFPRPSINTSSAPTGIPHFWKLIAGLCFLPLLPEP